MLKIRLRKPGKSIKRRYHYKMVVAEASTARESSFVEQVGYYDPSHKLLKIDIERYEKWVKSGAQPTQTVASLLKRYKKQLEGKLKPKKTKARTKRKKTK
ncbi:MAG: 30S ribosomal protein S16 [Candidatus Omnitrophica bacterium]|nr:30S ribosomal protein S16 [Candidatus Omnitrophota bacterium]